jgi:nucleoside-diphosphate-sugar epimerase
LIGFDEKYISFINVKDLARGIVDATLHPKAVGETYFITSREYYTWPEISTVTAAVLGKQSIRRIRLPHGVVLGLAGMAGFFSKFRSKPGVLDYEKGIDITRQYWICSPEKALRELGFQSQLSLHEGIQDTITWYREMGWL